MSALRRNRALLEPLLAGLPFAISSVRPSETRAEIELALATPAGDVQLRIATRAQDVKALAYTRSFAISYVTRDGAPLPRAAIESVAAFARRLAARDPGGLVLEAPERSPREQRRLAVVERDPGGSWSRATFDAGIEALRAEARRFDHAVLVVTQACEMACSFCPSRDKQHQVDPRVDARTHLDDLVHQLEAARSLGAHAVDVGGNDVLRFEHALELFERAGELGYQTIVAQSPGQRLADEAFARALSSGPLNAVQIPIYGATAQAHDAVTGTPGSFDTLCRALDVVLALGRPRVVLTTLALRSTLDGLEELLAFAQRRFGLHVSVRMLWPNRVGEREHLHDAVPFDELAGVVARHADRFETDLPVCVLPPSHLVRGLVRAEGGRALHLWDLGIVPGSEDDRVKQDRQRVFVAACNGCAARHRCAGILRAHVEALGAAGIRPLAALPG
ncbi:radical SAM protein [Sandaracinus amylolyticus]|uniref:Radical SAM core domain-containing protein n=1 Tax=Sandaracinus amylolyticus TaxID=927083 RepID=A0A0F6YKR2_9BACT|nr:radical SAM protein [Sandaracinus amylolyticus]AKF09453.1 hypothetical protein DB32_006602 [Sandaracinus amylolyticus]